MAHTAIAYAKAKKRTRAMAVTSSIGPGATNMVTAAALAHVNRLPVLLIPGDVFANRAPDPVLQQIEDFDDGTVSANDCFRPVSRYFDRISRPEHLLTALPRALRVMTDPANCGPVTLSFCQDTQAEAFDYPESFFEPKVWRIRRPEPDAREIADVTELIRKARNPVLLCGGGVIYSQAEETLADFATTHGIPVIETQAGKAALAQAHPMNFGTSGVDGAESANKLAEEADLVIGVGTRFQDFTTGSWALFKAPAASWSPSTSSPMTPASTARSPWSAMQRSRWRGSRPRLAPTRRMPLIRRAASTGLRKSTPIAAPAPTFPKATCRSTPR